MIVDAKTMMKAVVAMIVAFTLLPMIFTGYSNADNISTDYVVDSEDHWLDAATLTNLNVTDDGTVLLDDGETTGTYESPVVDRDGSTLNLTELAVTAVHATSTEDVTATVETSNDNFTTVKDSATFTVDSEGTSTFNVSDLDGEDARVTLDFERGASTDQSPELDSYELSFSYEASETIDQLLQLVLILVLVGIGLFVWRQAY